MTFGSLFAGVGGFDLGFERAGMECRWQVEIDPFCVSVLERHWPGVRRYGDITTVRGEDLERVDVICGGFPCQDLSQAGKRAGIEGTRSGLWFEFARIVGLVRPRYVVVENVPGILVRHAMRRVVGELAGLGYVGCWRSLRASEFGASHLRKRVFIIAMLADSECQRVERRRESGELGSASAAQPRQGIQRQWAGSAFNDSGHHLANGHAEGLGFGSAAHDWHGSDASGYNAHRRDEDVDDARRGQREQCGRSLADEGAVRGSDGGRRQMERVGMYRCDSCGGTTIAVESESGILPFYPCRWCGSGSLGTITYDLDHGGTGEPDEPERPPVADAGDGQLPVPQWRPEGRDGPRSTGEEQPFSHAVLTRLEERGRSGEPEGVARAGTERLRVPELADAHGLHGHHTGSGTGADSREWAAPQGLPQFAPGPADSRWADILRDFPWLSPALEKTPLSGVRRVFDGVPDLLDRAMSHRTNRLSRLGNAVVPQIPEWIGHRLIEFDTMRRSYADR